MYPGYCRGKSYCVVLRIINSMCDESRNDFENSLSTRNNFRLKEKVLSMMCLIVFPLIDSGFVF